MLIVLVDALIQNFYGSNLFGYDWPGRHDGPTMKIITGFFNEEKNPPNFVISKLGPSPRQLNSNSLNLGTPKWTLDLLEP